MSRFFFGLSTCLVLSVGCVGESFDSDDELDQVLTARQPKRDFAAFTTYAMPDEVSDLSALVEVPIERDGSQDAVVLASLAEGMAAAGYERLPFGQAEQADVVLLPGAVASENWTWVGSYPCWGYVGYCWWYPPVYVPVSFDVGSIVAVMVRPQEVVEDVEGADPSEPRDLTPVIWGLGVRGILGERNARIAERIRTTIAQGFAQSPYLGGQVEEIDQ